MKNTAENTIISLCNEVDYWKERAEYFEQLYRGEIEESIKLTNERLLDAKKGVANALMFALSV